MLIFGTMESAPVGQSTSHTSQCTQYAVLYVNRLKRNVSSFGKLPLTSNIDLLFISFINIYFNVERNDKIIMETIKVSSKSEPNKVAGALANVFREKGVVEVQAIGAGALNQAIKGVAIARGFVAPSGKNLVCTPAFIDINIDGEERTAIKLIVEAK